jgi:hypothetical protein
MAMKMDMDTKNHTTEFSEVSMFNPFEKGSSADTLSLVHTLNVVALVYPEESL